MQAIKIIRSCGATGGAVLIAGETYAVPAEVSQRDAELMIRLGKAEEASPGKKGRSKGKGEQDPGDQGDAE